MRSTLFTRWDTLMNKLKVGSPQCQKWYKNIETKYKEPQRYYHTLEHIEELFGYYDKYFTLLQKPEVVQLSIFFHDVIYDPNKNDNEEKSVEYFQQFCADTSPVCYSTGASLSLVDDYIIATKSHKTSGNDTDLNYFLDFDLAVLGKPSAEYKRYASQIRSEYLPVYPEPKYSLGRMRVLNHLSEGGLFITKEFQDTFEQTARNNLKEEIESLKLSTIDK
eukprot:TRINITY_DN6067_c0_g1_i1.p2 TRINITY_DN6067_c0_g1~~TRINITY_DN6067_c0_g1_i1.p2  ORF type:complete len:220 (-),score=31.26 TRINITY_DN6067_c0_g1_i1:20-679(-)